MHEHGKNLSKNSVRKAFLALTASVAAVSILPLASCEANKTVPSLDEHEEFNLQYGNFEDELNLFDMANVGPMSTSMAMRDGFFYISNTESKKIMGLNSYGDLLTLYFNDEKNPRPSFYDEEVAAITTRKAIAYPFNSISSIAVDSRKYIYVVDQISLERQEVDSENYSVFSQVVLRFDGNGRYIGSLGQQGVGGTPFPFVKSIYTTENNEVVVVCKQDRGTVVFWFDSNGNLYKKIPLEANFDYTMYDSDKNDGELWQIIENVIPDGDKRILYLKVDVYGSFVDEASHVQSGISYGETMIYPLNVDSMTYGKSFRIPSYQDQVVEGYNTETYSIPYDFLGVTSNGWMFFIISTEKGFSIEMVQTDGQKILRRNIALNQQEILYYTFCLSNTGILSMLNGKVDHAEIQWWRTDSLIQSVIKN